MNESLMLEWIKLVCNQRPGALLQLPNMLVLDSFRGHSMANVKRALCDDKTDLVVIPDELTSMLQPLTVVLNKPFKDRVHELIMNGCWATTRPPHRPTATSTAADCLWLGVVGIEIALRRDGAQILQMQPQQRAGRRKR